MWHPASPTQSCCRETHTTHQSITVSLLQVVFGSFRDIWRFSRRPFVQTYSEAAQQHSTSLKSTWNDKLPLHNLTKSDFKIFLLPSNPADGRKEALALLTWLLWRFSSKLGSLKPASSEECVLCLERRNRTIKMTQKKPLKGGWAMGTCRFKRANSKLDLWTVDTTKEGKIISHPSTNRFFNNNLKITLCSLLAVVHTLPTISAQFEYTAYSLKSNLCRKQMFSRKLQLCGQFFRKIMYQCSFLFTYVTDVQSPAHIAFPWVSS